MPQRANKLEFQFNNSIAELIPSLQLMLQYIGNCIPASGEAVLFRSQAILTELLTNAIKHAGVSHTLFSIKAGSHKITIKKADKGQPLNLFGENSNDYAYVLLAADPLNSLYVSRTTNRSVLFRCEENAFDDVLPVDQIMEHFGLLIISKSANKFTYHYNKGTQTNFFTVEIHF